MNPEEPTLWTVQDEPNDFVRPQPDLSEPEPEGIQRLLRPRKTVPKPPKVKKATPPYRAGMFVKPLEEMYTGLGMVLLPFDAVCAQAVIQQAGPCAEAMDKLAKDNEVVRRVLTGLITTSVWGSVIMAHAPIMAVVVMHHAGGKASGVAAQAEQFLKGQTVEPDPE